MIVLKRNSRTIGEQKELFSFGSSTSSVGEFKLKEFHRESIEAEIRFD
ncbi:MAG: hypothetical protein ACI32O_05060 [Enterococcus sp.]